MQHRLTIAGFAKCLVLSVIMLAVGCYEQPSAERLEYDAKTVQTLRQEIESVDWNE